jgi:hypothetical protein
VSRAATPRGAPAATVPTWEFGRLGLLVFPALLVLGAVSMALAPVVEPASWWVLVPQVVVVAALLLRLMVRSLRSNPAGILMEPGVVLLAAWLLYFGFGPLLYVFGPVEQLRILHLQHRVDAGQAMWITGVNSIGLALTGLAYVLYRAPLASDAALLASRWWARLSPTTVFALCTLLGLFAKYVLVLPYDLLLTDAVPANAARQLSRLLVVAILIGWAHRVSGPWWMAPAATLLMVLELVSGVLMFNKTESLLALLAAGIGHYLARRELRSLGRLSAAVLAVYIVIGPVVNYGRVELTVRGRGEPKPAGLVERVEIVASYFDRDTSLAREPEESARWWRRLNYVPVQQASFELARRGEGGDDFRLVPWLLVPRTFYPGKPVMTVAGVDLNEKLTGHRLSALAPGIFVDGYYQLGWLGFLVTSLTYGLALRVFRQIAVAVVQHRALVMYPLVFIGVYAGFRVDGWWLTDVAGPLLFATVALTGFRLMARE